MAGSLRDLLDKPSEADSRVLPTFLGEDAYQFTFRGGNCYCGSHDATTEGIAHHCGTWCVPDDLNICRVKVELWGTGGTGGGPSCYYNWGAPGSAAEYRSCMFCCSNNNNLYFDGTCWDFRVKPLCCQNCKGACTGCFTCLQENSGTQSVGGMKACGGCGGRQMCAAVNNPQTPAHVPYNFGRSTDCTSCTSAFDITATSFSSNTATLKSCCENGKCHHSGVVSAFYQFTSGQDLCSKMWYVPFPAGVMSTMGGFIAQEYRAQCNNACRMTIHRYYLGENIPGYSSAGATATRAHGGFPGQGGNGTYQGCSGCCTCASIGSTGMVRFTLYPDTNV